MTALKNILILVLLILVILLAALYRNEKHLETRIGHKNLQLSTDYSDMQQKSEQLSRAYQQLLNRQEYVQQGQITFVDERKYYRVNWKNYIHISANDYKSGFLGGIHDLEIIVNNQSDFVLDNVQVDVQYLKKGREVFKTEPLNINEVPPHSSRMIAAPDSKRGTSIQLDLKRITSQSMNFCYSEDKKPGGPKDDPYACMPMGAPLK